MDISILLALQSLRQSLPSFVEVFFAAITFLGDGPACVAITCVVYWCISKRAGQLATASLATSSLMTHFVKNIACVYRPWIRETAIQPSQLAIKEATGYSFPSGHATGSTSMYGSLAWFLRKRNKGLMACCIFMIAIICFSRVFLTVHTPQDVLAGIAIAIIAIVVANKFLNWIDRYDAMMPGHNKDIIVAVCLWVACIIATVFVFVKPYPMDYVNGALLVDPLEMQKSFFEAVGLCLGASAGWVLERRIVNFSTEGLEMRERIVRGVIGVGLVGIAYLGGKALFKAILPFNFGYLVAYTIVTFIAVFVAPLVFTMIENRQR